MIDISAVLTSAISYIDGLTGNNEFATAMVITMITGWLAYIAKGIPRTVINTIIKHGTTTMVVQSNVKVFYDIMDLFEENGVSANSRYIKVENGMWKEGKSTKAVGYGRQFMKIKGRYVFIDLTLMDNNNTPVDSLSMSILGRSHSFFDNILDGIRKTEKDPNITEYYTMLGNSPQYELKQPIRDMNTIYIDESEKRKLLDNIKDFYSNEEFYLKHGIPHQLGILLYGEPGTGKTSLIRAIAGYMQKDILVVDTPNQLISACSSNHDKIIVAEEIDTFGMASRNNIVGTQELDDDEMEYYENETAVLGNRSSNDTGAFALGQTLKALDGLFITTGRILIMTTNDVASLDNGLIRPGRIDIAIHVGYLSMESFTRMITVLFENMSSEGIQGMLVDRIINPDVTGAKVQSLIINGSSPQEVIEQFTKKVEDR